MVGKDTAVTATDAAMIATTATARTVALGNVTATTAATDAVGNVNATAAGNYCFERYQACYLKCC